MKQTIIFGLVLLAGSLVSVGNEPQKVEEARRTIEEYETGERVRALVALNKARDLVDGHERGTKQATEEQLAAARDLLRKNDEQQASERQRVIDAVPVFVVLNRGSTVDLGKLLHAANREYVKFRIVELKEFFEGDEENGTDRIREELQFWEKALIDMKPTGKVLGGVAATIFEGENSFVVAYFESTRMQHFACRLSKETYTPISGREVSAFNATQKGVLILD